MLWKESLEKFKLIGETVIFTEYGVEIHESERSVSLNRLFILQLLMYRIAIY